MKPDWLFGGSNDSHFLIAAFCTVWIIQGGYFAWTLVQSFRISEASLTPGAEDRN